MRVRQSVSERGSEKQPTQPPSQIESNAAKETQGRAGRTGQSWRATCKEGSGMMVERKKIQDTRTVSLAIFGSIALNAAART